MGDVSLSKFMMLRMWQYMVYVPHNVLGKRWSFVCVPHSIVDDMDEPTGKLIGRHNYCTQVRNGGYHT